MHRSTLNIKSVDKDKTVLLSQHDTFSKFFVVYDLLKKLIRRGPPWLARARQGGGLTFLK